MVVDTVKDRLRQAAKLACKRMVEIEMEMEPLYEGYNRFIDLDIEHKRHAEHANRILSSLGQEIFLETVELPEFSEIKHAFHYWRNYCTLHCEQPLWESIRAVLAEMGEMREADLVLAIGALGLSQSTSAIQSAVRAHPEAFVGRRARRKKFVSLKKGL